MRPTTQGLFSTKTNLRLHVLKRSGSNVQKKNSRLRARGQRDSQKSRRDDMELSDHYEQLERQLEALLSINAYGEPLTFSTSIILSPMPIN